jgi:predicted ATPase
MLTRLEIDNFRCFEGFVWEPARKQLILGANGCGKSSMMDALVRLKSFVAEDARVEESFPLRERTRSLNRQEQRLGLHVETDGVTYCYRLVVGASGDQPVIRSETLDCGNGAFRVSSELGTRSAIPTLVDTESAALAAGFRRWMKSLCCFRLNPLEMDSRALGEDVAPKVDLSNFAAWYRYLNRTHHPERADAFFESLKETLDGFVSIVLEDTGDGAKQLSVLFERKYEMPVSFRFDELSDGQRCLICLYAIIHFPMLDGKTVMIDEPESFIGLREVQPWHQTADDAATDSHGQLILISHHPELIDQWAPRLGVRFRRDGAGPIQVKPWVGDSGLMISAGGIVARGWDDD